MTLLTGTLDSDSQRAERFLEAAQRLAPALPWLARTDTRAGRLSLRLTAVSQVPFATIQEPAGRALFVLGDILQADQLDNAAWLHAQCRNNEGLDALARQNGYYLAGVVDEHDTVYLAADQLGLMPLYYWSHGDCFSFSTSPNAFHSHPEFVAKPDLTGIAGILLSMYAIGDRTTWQGVRRLPPGHLLRWRAGEGVTLTDINSLKAHDAYFQYPPSLCQGLIQNAFNKAVQRRAKLGETSILLSGGLDSRLVAGCLRWHATHKVPALTLGEPRDYEMQCARGVAKQLGWPMHPARVDLDAYPDWAPVQARLEGSHSSFVEFMWWQALDTAHKLKPRIMTGLLGDAVMGGSQIAYAFNPETRLYDFSKQFSKLNRLGYRATIVSKLLKQPGLAESVVEEMQRTWASYSGLSAQKAWLFDLHHRQRLHVGAASWRLSFGAWPTMPYADAELLHVMAGMAPPAFAERCAQNNMLSEKFPQLAALPLDRGGPDTRPVMPSLGWKLTHEMRGAWGNWRTANSTVERRQFVRHYDPNGRGWRAIRSMTDNIPPSISSLFDIETLTEMLPKSDSTLPCPDPIIDGARYKTMLGLFLNLSSHAFER
jgi:asparagine synthase (glutamine-hydrolysing)